MSTPTDQQQIRATINRMVKHSGPDFAATVVTETATSHLGVVAMQRAIERDGRFAGPIPPLMGTAEVAAAFGIANSNISKLKDPPVPVARISGGKVPVFLASEVMAKVAARNGGGS